MSEELMPCPFCGGEAEMRKTAHWDFYVRCRKCGAKTAQHNQNEPGAVMDWNRRVKEES